MARVVVLLRGCEDGSGEDGKEFGIRIRYDIMDHISNFYSPTTTTPFVSCDALRQSMSTTSSASSFTIVSITYYLLKIPR